MSGICSYPVSFFAFLGEIIFDVVDVDADAFDPADLLEALMT